MVADIISKNNVESRALDMDSLGDLLGKQIGLLKAIDDMDR